ncbi:Hypothetical protein ORPV_665 [Orpheovirus IHUMI-LCC2]|uniref:Uncharacterized protein n=1 Tax=Orpheovirus IHUMI-LCC2 TaxID=2023057 RepID=A0A2I2L535_9VIRU|nr:Hypothetical protein ORPV_665 [Orpheovirus IHUMI-LCC2]SNW62569.1 Hypothetical protein ORPV_665 [Orpheovirus IHUMI-LCC2]
MEYMIYYNNLINITKLKDSADEYFKSKLGDIQYISEYLYKAIEENPNSVGYLSNLLYLGQNNENLKPLAGRLVLYHAAGSDLHSSSNPKYDVNLLLDQCKAEYIKALTNKHVNLICSTQL